MASTNFIQECKKRAYANRLGKLIVDNHEITNADNLQEFSIESGCYVDGNIIGSIYLKKLTGSILSKPDDINLIDNSIEAQVGVKYENSTTEYISLGKYKVERPEDEITENYSTLTAYDELINKIDSKYISRLDYENNSITIKDLYKDVCEQLELEYKTDEFINNNIQISSNPFVSNETNRTVLKTIAIISCSFVTIDEETNEIDLSWFSDSEEPDYTFEKSDYTSVSGGLIQYGPINQLIIKNSQIDDENVMIQDDESIEENGLHSISISEDYILYNSDLRTLALNGMFQRINGFKYIDCSLETSYGKPFLKVGNKIRIYTDEDDYFDTYVLNQTFKYDGQFTSKIESKAMTQTEINNKQNVNLGTIIKNTQIIVNKQDQEIKSIVSEQNKQSEKIVQVTQDINNIQNLFQVTGGNNLIKDSQLLLGDDVWTYDKNVNYSIFPSNSKYPSSSIQPIEYYYSEPKYTGGYDAELIGKTVSISKIGVQNGKMYTSSNNIENLVIGNQYTLSYKVSNDENTVSKIKLLGNGNVIYEAVYNEKEEFKEEAFSFIATTNKYTLQIQSTTILNGFVYVYDLMLNAGDTMPWEPASGEIVGTTLKLSQNGLQIYCTGSDIATLMTAEGFQIRRFENGTLYEIVTEFTKDGYISKKGFLNELEINDFEFKTIKYNSYDTLIIYKKD